MALLAEAKEKINQELIANGSPALLDRLDENFLFLMSLVEKAMTDLSEEQKVFVNAWLTKLGSYDTVDSYVMKSERNFHMGKLITCMQNKVLEEPFNEMPPQGHLNVVQFTLPALDEAPEWFDKLMEKEENDDKVGGKNFETYVATKLFENGRGACAYVAVSADIEGDTSAWVKFKPSHYIKLEKMMHQELGKYQEGVEE